MSGDSKPYAMIAGERAIYEHFIRTGVSGTVKFVGYGYQPNYEIPVPNPLVSIIIPTRNGLKLLKQCIDGIFNNTSYKNYEILIIDNGSDDPETLNYIHKLSLNEQIRIIRDNSLFNYSALNNKAVSLANGEVIILLNNDTKVISADWLSVMVAHALRPGIGAVGAKLWYGNKTIQHGGVILGINGVASHAHKHFPPFSSGYAARLSVTQSLSAVTAACLAIRKSIFIEVGGLDEKNLAVAFNDVDFCLRVRELGYRNLWAPNAELYHHESATRRHEDTPEEQKRFSQEVDYMKMRWGEALLNDPAYSPNLTLDYDDFSYAWPPRIEVI
jgi:GT2 family glycosyltransferase